MIMQHLMQFNVMQHDNATFAPVCFTFIVIADILYATSLELTPISFKTN